MSAPQSHAQQAVSAGTRVQIRYTLLTATERAPGLPEDTRAVPYEIRANGILLADGHVGAQASLRTSAGRELRGTLDVVEPADEHTFGRPHPALLQAIAGIERLREELEG
jgi:hypothetical protein